MWHSGVVSFLEAPLWSPWYVEFRLRLLAVTRSQLRALRSLTTAGMPSSDERKNGGRGNIHIVVALANLFPLLTVQPVCILFNSTKELENGIVRTIVKYIYTYITLQRVRVVASY